jgi:hypothetical protein
VDRHSVAGGLWLAAKDMSEQEVDYGWFFPVYSPAEPGRIVSLFLLPPGIERRIRSRAALTVLLDLLAGRHEDERPPLTGLDADVEPLVEQLIASLSEAPASPPAQRVALVAA